MTPNPPHNAIGWQLLITGGVLFGIALVLGLGVGGVQLISLPTLILIVLAAIAGWCTRQFWQSGRYGLAWGVLVATGLAVVVGLIALIYALAAAFASGPDW